MQLTALDCSLFSIRDAAHQLRALGAQLPARVDRAEPHPPACRRSHFLLLWSAEALMTRTKSLWSELQREMDRRQRVAVARERSQQQMIRQLVQERERAVRQAARAEAAERKRQQKLAHGAGIAAAKALKEQLEARLAELRTLLTSALAKPPELSFASLKRSPNVPPFDPHGLAEPFPLPAWDAFASPPGPLSGLVGGKARPDRRERRQARQEPRRDEWGCSRARAADRQGVHKTTP
jgi:hypothetical protein